MVQPLPLLLHLNPPPPPYPPTQVKLGASQRAERCTTLPAHVVERARLVKQMAIERQHTVNLSDSSDDSSDIPSYHASEDEGLAEDGPPEVSAAAAAPAPAAAPRRTEAILPTPPPLHGLPHPLPPHMHGLPPPPLPSFMVRPPPPPPPPQALLWREAKAPDGRMCTPLPRSSLQYTL